MILVASLLTLFLTTATLGAEQDTVSRGHHGGEGWAGQYHYNGWGSPGYGGYGGLSFDYGTGLFLCLSVVIVLLLLAALWYPSYGGGGWGRSGPGSVDFGASASAFAEKVITSLEKAYEVYNTHIKEHNHSHHKKP